jgi:hypothetical protein
MLYVMKHWQRMLVISLLVSLPLLSSCTRERVHYFPESSKILLDSAGKGVCSYTNYDCVLLSKAQFMDITTANTNVKVVTVEAPCKEGVTP